MRVSGKKDWKRGKSGQNEHEIWKEHGITGSMIILFEASRQEAKKRLNAANILKIKATGPAWIKTQVEAQGLVIFVESPSKPKLSLSVTFICCVKKT